MRYDLQVHHRRSIRLQGHDYSQAGMYFVTVCAHDRDCLFGQIVDGRMQLNAFGEIVEDEWLRTADIRPNAGMDAFVIMPNHVHGIIVLRADAGGTSQRAPTHDIQTNDDTRRGTLPRAPADDPQTNDDTRRGTLPRAPTGGGRQVERFGRPTSNTVPTIVRLFKSATTRRINTSRQTPGAPVWQRNYYERVIRDEAEWERLRDYIETNPARWWDDRENPYGKT